MTDDQLLRTNDNLIEWLGAQNEATGAYLNLATCTFTVYDEAGTVVPGTLNTSMSYVDGSNGNYLGTLDAAIAASLTRHGIYYVEITLIQGELKGHKRRRCVAVDRD